MPTQNSPTNEQLRYLARELATGIRSCVDVLASIGITLDQFADIAITPEFTTLLLDEKRRWLETGNTRTRVRTKTSFLLETLIEQVSGDIIDPTLPLGPRTALLKTLANISGLETIQGLDSGLVHNTGNVFNLEIHYSNGETPTMITLGERVPEKGRSGDPGRSGVIEGAAETVEVFPRFVEPPLPAVDYPESNSAQGDDIGEDDIDDDDIEEDIDEDDIVSPLLPGTRQ